MQLTEEEQQQQNAGGTPSYVTEPNHLVAQLGTLRSRDGETRVQHLTFVSWRSQDLVLVSLLLHPLCPPAHGAWPPVFSSAQHRVSEDRIPPLAPQRARQHGAGWAEERLGGVGMVHARGTSSCLRRKLVPQRRGPVCSGNPGGTSYFLSTAGMNSEQGMTPGTISRGHSALAFLACKFFCNLQAARSSWPVTCLGIPPSRLPGPGLKGATADESTLRLRHTQGNTRPTGSWVTGGHFEGSRRGHS